jgi:hypothetical protein
MPSRDSEAQGVLPQLERVLASHGSPAISAYPGSCALWSKGIWTAKITN